MANGNWLDAMAIKNIADGSLGNPETQLAEFALDFAVTPTGVISGETENKVFDFLAGRWSSTLVYFPASIFTTLRPISQTQLAKTPATVLAVRLTAQQPLPHSVVSVGRSPPVE